MAAMLPNHVAAVACQNRGLVGRCKRMSGIGPGPEDLLGAALNEQAELVQTVSDLTFHAHVSAAIAARTQAASNAQTQLDAHVAAENDYGPAGDILQNLDALSLKASSDLLTAAGTIAQKDEVSAIQRFKLGSTVEDADLATLAKIDNEAGITLGMLDTSA